MCVYDRQGSQTASEKTLMVMVHHFHLIINDIRMVDKLSIDVISRITLVSIKDSFLDLFNTFKH